MEILILTTEPLPFPGLVTTGAGLRAWGLARGLESGGLAVEAAMPDDHLDGLEPERRAAVEPHCFSRARLSEFVRGLLRRYYPEAADRVTRIPAGVDVERFAPGDREAARRRFGLPADAGAGNRRVKRSVW
jgi:hypothetical protein